MKLMHIALIGLLLLGLGGIASAESETNLVEVSDTEWEGYVSYEDFSDYTTTLLGAAGYTHEQGILFNAGFGLLDVSKFTDMTTIIISHSIDGKSELCSPSKFVDSIQPPTISLPVAYTIDGNTVGSGEYQANFIYYSTYPYAIKNIIVLFTFDELDLSGLSGAKRIIPVYGAEKYNYFTEAGWNNEFYGPDTIYQVTHGSYNAGSMQTAYGSDYLYYPALLKSIDPTDMVTNNLEVTIYRDVSFYQEFNFTDFDDYYYLNYDRGLYTNYINITDSEGDELYGAISSSDIISKYYSKDIPYTFWVDNPYSEVYDFEFELPLEYELTPVDSITGTYYVYDTSTGSLISNVHCVENTTLDGGGLDDSSGSVPYQHTFDTDAYNRWELYFYADGYENSTICRYHQPPYAANPEWSLLWDSFQENVYLTPTGTPSNTTATVSFKVNKEMGFAGAGVYWYGSGASVTLDGVTKLTSSQGLTSFTVDNNDTYAYTVTLADRVPVQGSVTVGTTNEHVEVTLYFPAKDDPVPTETQPSGVYDNRPFNEKADDALAVIFDNIVMFAQLATLVLIVSMLKWLKI